jgi:hypothetical protein
MERFFRMKLFPGLYSSLLLSLALGICGSAAAQDAPSGPRAVPVVWDELIADWRVMSDLPPPEHIEVSLMKELELRADHMLTLIDELVMALPYGYRERAPIELSARRVRKQTYRYRNASMAQVPGAIIFQRKSLAMELEGLVVSFPEGDRPELPADNAPSAGSSSPAPESDGSAGS